MSLSYTVSDSTGYNVSDLSLIGAQRIASERLLRNGGASIHECNKLKLYAGTAYGSAAELTLTRCDGETVTIAETMR